MSNYRLGWPRSTGEPARRVQESDGGLDSHYSIVQLPDAFQYNGAVLLNV